MSNIYKKECIMGDTRFSVGIFAACVMILSSAVLSCPQASAEDLFRLWSGETTMLRGANIHQRRVYPELDGGEYLGGGPIGPPFTQADFRSSVRPGGQLRQYLPPGTFH